jgi:hypothetical protein
MTADPTLLRAFEIVGTAVAAGALVLSLRERKPFYLGLFIACVLMIFWDWTFNTRWFFNVRFDTRLAALWTIGGEDEPYAAALAYVGFYYFVFHFLVKEAHVLDRRVGRWQWPALYVASCAYVLIFEAIFVGQGVWTYYQKPGFELAGVAWSNAFFNAHLIVFSYAMLRLFRRWMHIDDTLVGLRVRSEEYWKQFVAAVGAVHTGFFLAFVVQMGWYIAAHPWLDGPRHF